jgi:hypothetical protein
MVIPTVIPTLEVTDGYTQGKTILSSEQLFLWGTYILRIVAESIIPSRQETTSLLVVTSVVMLSLARGTIRKATCNLPLHHGFTKDHPVGNLAYLKFSRNYCCGWCITSWQIKMVV